ncbi:MAG: stalk domain-containing protein, partial [Acidobacteriota bacterium]
MKRKRLRESRLIGLLLLVAAQTSGQSHPEEVVVIFPRGREAIPVSVFAGVSMLPLDKIADLVGASIHTEPRSSAATFSVGGRTARISPGRALLRVEGELVLLSAPSTVRAGRWFVPLDFLGKVLPRVAGESITYRDDLRLLVIGEGFPRLSVRALPYPAYTRVVVESTIEIPFQVTQAGRQVQVLVLANYLETDFQAEELR